MLNRIARRHTAVVAYLALFLTVGGGAAYAQRYMYTGADIVDGSLTGADLAPASVNGDKVANGSLKAEDLGQKSVGAAELDLKIQHVSHKVTNNDAQKSVKVDCPAGYVALGGGASVAPSTWNGTGKLAITNNGPDVYGNGWQAAATTIAYEQKKTNWAHSHYGDEVHQVTWKDWIWVDVDYQHEWTLTVTARCVEL